MGGLNGYRRAIPCFLGLALGDYLLSNIWGILSIVTNTPLYQFFPLARLSFYQIGLVL